MKSSENNSVTNQLYNFYRSFVFQSSLSKEEFIKTYYSKINPQLSISKLIIEDIKEIDDRIFELLNKLYFLEIIEGASIQMEYSDHYLPIELLN